MKTTKKFSAFLVCLFFAAACTYEFPEETKPTSGEADFSKMVVVGSSLSAGFMNGALYTDGQMNSSMAILANQMALVGGGEFNQPDINSVNGYYGVAPGPTILGRLYFKVNSGTNCLETPNNPDITPKPGETIGAFSGEKDALNNFSAYGVTLYTAMQPELGGPSSANPLYNPYYERFASTPGASTLMGDVEAALENGGTFFVFWLGADDVYAYALNGADKTDLTKPLTSNVNFDALYDAAVNIMLDAETGDVETKGVLANIPSLTDLPYFTTVKWNQIVFLDCNPTHVATVDQLNSGSVYGGYNAALDYLASDDGGNFLTQTQADARKVTFHTGATAAAGANAIVIKDQTLTDIGPQLAAINAGLAGFGQVRQANANDLITLAAGSVLPTGVGVSPAAGFLTDKYVLLPAEQAEIQASIDHFNETIRAKVEAHSNRLALVDVNAALTTLRTTSVTINGSAITATFTPPFGAFSLDGVHLNARGNAYIANKFIQAINSKFGSTIPLANPNSYPGVELPIP